MIFKSYHEAYKPFASAIRQGGGYGDSYTITNKEFVRIWQTSSNLDEVQDRLSGLRKTLQGMECQMPWPCAKKTYFPFRSLVWFHSDDYILRAEKRLKKKGVLLRDLSWVTDREKPCPPCPWEQLNEYAQSFPEEV